MTTERAARQPRAPKPLSDARLQAMAQWYAERYVPTRARLLAYLRRRALKPGAFTPQSLGDLEARIHAVTEKLAAAGLIDDFAWARGRLASLQARGKSLQAIRADLRLKGVPEPVAEALLAPLTDAPGHSDLVAALTYARRRRLGPYARSAAQREANATRDLSALGRQGFSYDIARQVLALDDEQEADTLRLGSQA